MPPTEIDANAVIDRLLQRIARLEYELAVAQEIAEQVTRPITDGEGETPDG